MVTVSASLPSIYDQTVSIVSSGGTPPGSLNGPISSGTAITLPSSGTYTVQTGVPNINIFLNGDRLEYGRDWLTSGSGPNYTQFQLTFGLVAFDYLDLRTERNS
jgi:hypothetical protein